MAAVGSLGADNGKGKLNNTFEIHLIFQSGPEQISTIGCVFDAASRFVFKYLNPPLPPNLFSSIFPPSYYSVLKNLSHILANSSSILISIIILIPEILIT